MERFYIIALGVFATNPGLDVVYLTDDGMPFAQHGWAVNHGISLRNDKVVKVTRLVAEAWQNRSKELETAPVPEVPEGGEPAGSTAEGDAPEGDAPDGEDPEGEDAEGDTQEGDAPEDEDTEGDAPEGSSATPDESWTVKDIQDWLTANGIAYTGSHNTKAKLLALIQVDNS